jgi:hypothetical protein
MIEKKTHKQQTSTKHDQNCQCASAKTIDISRIGLIEDSVTKPEGYPSTIPKYIPMIPEISQGPTIVTPDLQVTLVETWI